MHSKGGREGGRRDGGMKKEGGGRREGGGKGGRREGMEERDRGREGGREGGGRGEGRKRNTMNARMQAHVVILRGEHGIGQTCMSSFKASSLFLSLPNESVIKPGKGESGCVGHSQAHTAARGQSPVVTSCN